jgi:predicted transcriptional regulator
MTDSRNSREDSLLTPAEWKVMKVVWRHRYRGCAARDVYTETARTEGWAPTTTKSILKRLVDKGHLSVRQVGNAYLYEPAGSAVKSLLAAADSLIENLLEGTSGLVISHMLERTRLTDDELARLRDLIDRRTADRPEDEKDPKNA